MDPNDPDGSYDMCLSRPETVKSLCKVQIDPCVQAEPLILDFVYARLAAMRVDSCTNEVKECLQSEDRCGEDYTQCIGLDTDTIIRMCPYDKLVGCQKVYEDTDIRGDAVYEELSTMVQGIMLNIDNSLMTECQNAANEAMIKVCGDVEGCSAFDMDEHMGAESLVSHKEENGDYVIEGLVSFANVKIKEVESTADNVKFGTYEVDLNDYQSKLNEADASAVRVMENLQGVANKINRIIEAISEDPKVKMCTTGRDLSQIFGDSAKRGNTKQDGKTQRDENVKTARFPHLLDSMMLNIINYGMDRAKENYNKKYEEMVGEAIENTNDDQKAAICAAMATNPNHLQCTSRRSCRSASPLASLFTDDIGGSANSDATQEKYATRYVISGLSMQDKMKVAASGDYKFYQTDGRGHMIGMVKMSSVYSPDSNVCTITTTTTACKNLKESSSWVRGWIKGRWWNAHLYNGVTCSEFDEPQESTLTIKL